MKRVFLAVLVLVTVAFALGGCKDREEPISQPGGEGGVFVPPVTQVVVPDSVKNKWGAVKLTIENKKDNSADDVDVAVGGEYVIPGSNLVIKVGDFLPDFKMDGAIITSTSEEMNNPAVHVTILDGQEEVFKGWLYSKFPAIHPFMHEQFGVTLKDAVEKTG
jgi:hypothetical protein